MGIKPLGQSRFGGSKSMQSLAGLEKNTSTPVDQQIADLLLANNCNLLALICQSSFVGDTAASVSEGVLSLLRRQRGRGTEMFLKRLLRGRIAQYLKKSRDLSDIIRDNSMATMLLNAFARYEGISYLGQSLSDPLHSILTYVDKCEIDPQKLLAASASPTAKTASSPVPTESSTVTSSSAASATPTSPAGASLDTATIEDSAFHLPDDIVSQLEENETRLKQACEEVLNSIIGKREMMPGAVRRMCHFLRITVEEIYKELGIFVVPTSGTLEASGDGDSGIASPGSVISTSGTGLGGSQPDIATVAPLQRRNSAARERPKSMFETSTPTSNLARATPITADTICNSPASNSTGDLGFGTPRGVNGPLHEEAEEGTASPNPSVGSFQRLRKKGKSKDSLATANTSEESVVVYVQGHEKEKSTTDAGGLASTPGTAPGTLERDRSVSGGPVTQIRDVKKARSSVIVVRNSGSTFRMRSASAEADREKGMQAHAQAAMKSEAKNLPSSVPVPSPLSATSTETVASEDSVATTRRRRAASMSSVATQRSMHTLTISEKVVGSFLFLRFFVPALTAPETFGLLDTKVPAPSRRGLVLCGKVLTAMCNDVEFGNKEKYLMPLNGFLKAHRDKVKDFLVFASEEVKEEDDTDNTLPPPLPTAANPLIARNKVAPVSSQSPRTSTTSTARPTSALFSSSKALSRSLPSLKADLPPNASAASSSSATPAPSASTPPAPKRRPSSEFPGTDNLFLYLGKSLTKIEHDLEEQVSTMNPDQGQKILDDFYELKKVVEGSVYFQGGPGGKGKGTGQGTTLFGRLGQKLGLFQKGKSPSSSLDDVRTSSARSSRTARSSFQSVRQPLSNG